MSATDRAKWWHEYAIRLKMIKKKEIFKVMKRTVKGNKVLAVILSLVVVMSAAIPVNAASADVNIEVKATTMDNMSVTIPSTYPMVFNEDGTNTLPLNWVIENISDIAGIHLTKIDMNANSSGWKLLAESQDTKQLKADTKAIKFYVGRSTDNLKLVAPTTGNEGTTGSVSFDVDEVNIQAGQSRNINFNVERGAFTQDIASAKAYDMVLTFNFN